MKPELKSAVTGMAIIGVSTTLAFGSAIAASHDYIPAVLNAALIAAGLGGIIIGTLTTTLCIPLVTQWKQARIKRRGQRAAEYLGNSLSGTRQKTRYEDERICIEHETIFGDLKVELKTGDQKTKVFHWDNFRKHSTKYRPGRWEEYLEMLDHRAKPAKEQAKADKRQAKADKRQAKFSAIDDTDVFANAGYQENQ